MLLLGTDQPLDRFLNYEIMLINHSELLFKIR